VKDSKSVTELILKSIESWKTWQLVLLLGVVAAVVYAASFGNGWTLDDFPVIVDNPDVTGLRAFWEDSYPGRPLREVTYLLDYALFGLDPVGYHVQNIFWHALAGSLLFLVVCQLGSSRRAALAAALLFLVHPLGVEVVANTSHRKDSLALVFMLLAWWGLEEFRRREKGYLFLGLAGVSLGLGLLAKQNAAAWPLFVVGYFFWGGRWYGAQTIGRRVAITLAASVAAISGYLVLLSVRQDLFFSKAIPVLSKMNTTLAAGDISTYLTMVLKSLAFMAVKIVWPLSLAVEYVFSPPQGWFAPWTMAGILILASCMMMLMVGGKNRVLLWGGAGF